MHVWASPICLYIPHTSRGHLKDHLYIFASVMHFCVSVHPFVSSCIGGGLLYQLTNIIVGYLQSHIWLAWVPMYLGTVFIAVLLSVGTGGLQVCARLGVVDLF